MEILIEFIVWVFRTLFGEQEPPARLGPGERRGDVEGNRGPYDYGDGRGSGQNKTLAELLEEARRQSQGGGTRTQIPPPKPPQPRQIVVPPPVKHEMPKPLAPAQVTIPAPVQVTMTMPAPIVQTAPPAPKKGKKRKAQATTPLQDLPVLGLKAPAQTSYIRMAEAPKRGAQLAPFFAALRGEAGRNRSLMGAQAVVIQEVFGAPRCRKPYRSHQR